MQKKIFFCSKFPTRCSAIRQGCLFSSRFCSSCPRSSCSSCHCSTSFYTRYFCRPFSWHFPQPSLKFLAAIRCFIVGHSPCYSWKFSIFLLAVHLTVFYCRLIIAIKLVRCCFHPFFIHCSSHFSCRSFNLHFLALPITH